MFQIEEASTIPLNVLGVETLLKRARLGLDLPHQKVIIFIGIKIAG